MRYALPHFFPSYFYSKAGPPDLKAWTEMAENYDNLTNSVSIPLMPILLMLIS